jgi:DNA replication protein DnaC
VTTTTTSTAPPLPADLEDLLRKLRLPHIRRHAPEVVATAKAQRWEPAEVLKALFAEEVAGRERSALATRRAAAGFPTGKTFDAWQPEISSIPAPTQQALRTLVMALTGIPQGCSSNFPTLGGCHCSGRRVPVAA